MSGLARGVIGHGTGILCSILVAALGPRIMDGLVCFAGKLGALHVGDNFCTEGSAGLGEGGLALSWVAMASLLGLVAIMEALFWLGRWYRAPAWWGVVALLVGCPILLGLVTVITGARAAEAIVVGLIMGTPVALASTAYWLALRVWRTRSEAA